MSQGLKVGGKKQNCGFAQDTKKHILIKYFVRTGYLRYLGTQQDIILSLKKDSIWGVKVALF